MSQTSPTSFRGAVALGARLGFKWTTYITGPIWLLALFIATWIWTFRFWFIDGIEILTNPDLRWEILTSVVAPIGGYFVSCMWGIIAGLMITVPMYFIKRKRRPTSKVD
jgi:hypothetical protein